MSNLKKKAMSRQRRYQLRMIARGRCGRCGRLRNRLSDLCDDCGWQRNGERRERYAKAQALITKPSRFGIKRRAAGRA